MTDKANWPQWLLHAHTSGATVEVLPSSGRVIWRDGEWHGGVWHGGEWRGGVWRGGEWRGGVWHDGEWRDGEWHGGVWRDGEWRGGVWRGGAWCDGVWRDGVWCGGVWCDGVWRDGEWRGGVWRGGVWRGGYCAATRAYYPVSGDGERIKIGCETRAVDEWEMVISGESPLPEGAPERGTEQWRLLVAAYRAQLEYQRVLKEEGERP